MRTSDAAQLCRLLCIRRKLFLKLADAQIVMFHFATKIATSGEQDEEEKKVCDNRIVYFKNHIGYRAVSWADERRII